MDLPKRQRRFLKAAYKMAPSGKFIIEKAGGSINFGADESRQIAHLLEIGGYLHKAPDLDRPNAYGERAKLLNADGLLATLTDKGKEQSRQIHDDERANFWRWVRRVVFYLWSIGVTIFLAYANHKIEHIEKQREEMQSTSRPTSQH